jgi:hypothetical protein
VHDDVTAVLSHSPLIKIKPGELRDIGIQHGTRLLVIEKRNTRDPTSYEHFARQVVGGGGPAVLIVQSMDRGAGDNFLAETYAAILHGEPLSNVKRFASHPDVGVWLYLGQSADRSLMLSDGMKDMRRDIVQLRRRIKDRTLDTLFGYLHDDPNFPEYNVSTRRIF